MAASRILVGHDGSPHAEDALALGQRLSALTGAKLILARVVPWEPLPLSAVPIPELKNRYEKQERAALAELQRAADRVGASAEAGPGESPTQGLHLLAEELNPDIVVVGSSHRGRIGQVLAGNVALRLLNGLDRPLAVAPAGYADRAGELRAIGVGFDGSPEARAALETAHELALAAGVDVRVISAERHGGGPIPVLLAEARALDLLVLGSRGYGPVRRVLLGSVSSDLVRGAACPVMVVPRPGPGESDELAARDAARA